MAQQTQINGNRYSFSSITVAIAGNLQPRVFKSINYDAAQDPGNVQANQSTIVGRTQGYGLGTGSFEMLVSEFDDLALQLSLGGLTAIMNVDFNISVTYAVNNGGFEEVRTDDLIGCRITKVGSANTQGTDATMKACDLSIARIRLNGIDAYGDANT